MTDPERNYKPFPNTVKFLEIGKIPPGHHLPRKRLRVRGKG